MDEMSGQIGFLFFLVGFIILLLFILIGRVSSLTRTVSGLKKTIKDTEANIITHLAPPSSGAGQKPVPNAVIAAISAALDQYRMENR